MALEINYPETPAGKRTIKRNIYGNVNGYVGGKKFWEFGEDETTANFWVGGETLARAYCECWIEN